MQKKRGKNNMANAVAPTFMRQSNKRVCGMKRNNNMQPKYIGPWRLLDKIRVHLI